jgi:hypothetical protein
MGSKLLSIAVAVLALTAVTGSAWAQQQPTGSWAAEQGNQYFYYGAMATDGTYMYIFGGYQGSYQYMYRYDPAANTWLQRANLPLPSYFNGGAYYNGRIFSLGNAYYGNGGIFAYTISTNTWTTLSPTLTGNRYYCSAATLGDRIYVTGGYYNGYSTLCDEFNPTNDTLTARANMPGGTYMHCMASVDALNKTYVMGGYNNGYLAVCYEYTPPSSGAANGTWATMAAISNGQGQQQPRGERPAAFSLNNRIYLAGGYNNGQQQTTLEYNPNSNTWAQRANMSSARYYTAGVSINGKGYVYGGPPAYTAGEEFTPPDFGLPPNPPTNVAQAGSQADTALQAQTDPAQRDGWTDANVSFSANVTDPNASQQVRLRVQVKRTTVSAWTNLDTGLQAQGNLTINFPVPSDGAYDWRWRVEDSFGNAIPAAPGAYNDAFGNANSPDFRSDQIPPSVPLPLFPGNVDIQSPTAGSGDIVLFWEEATDNGPVSGISYEIQVAREAGFTDIEAQLFSTAGNDQYPVTLSVDRNPKFWRLRARDVGGNLSAWSPALTFRVTFNDGANHSSGDAKKACGLSAPAASAGSLTGALFGLAMLAMASGRRLFRK